jgi:hypothetical protein
LKHPRPTRPCRGNSAVSTGGSAASADIAHRSQRRIGKTTWTTALALGDNGAGFRDLAFSSSKVAWVVYGPVSDFPADFGKLYVTRDGGQHWQLVTP